MADLDPVTPPVAAVETTPEPSLAEHEAQFGDAQPTPDGESEPEPTSKATRGADGKFAKGHRAAKAEAGAADVPRIAELTRKLREAERTLETERAARTAQPPAAKTPVVAEPRPATKPKVDDFQEYGDYVEALADWKIAEARRVDRETSQQQTARTELETSWRSRVDAAKSRYTDFDKVALESPTKIQPGSLIDAWILEDEDGADVLYELQRDDLAGGHLLQDLLTAPNAIKQAKMLSQLALRLSPPTRTPAAVTGAAAATPRSAAPRPPTPVRTSAVQTADEPPGDDASIAEHEKFYNQRRR